jgi:hypothetical protein
VPHRQTGIGNRVAASDKRAKRLAARDNGLLDPSEAGRYQVLTQLGSHRQRMGVHWWSEA